MKRKRKQQLKQDRKRIRRAWGRTEASIHLKGSVVDKARLLLHFQWDRFTLTPPVL